MARTVPLPRLLTPRFFDIFESESIPTPNLQSANTGTGNIPRKMRQAWRESFHERAMWTNMGSSGGEGGAVKNGTFGDPGNVIKPISEFERSIAHLSFEEVTRGALSFMNNRLGIVRASVALLKDDGRDFLMFDSTLEISGLESGQVIALSSASLRATVEQGTAIYRADIREWPIRNAVDAALLAAGLHSTLSVPLAVADKRLGTLNAAARDVDGIQPYVQQVIELLAPRLAFAIHAGIAHDRTTESESRFRDVFDAVGDGIAVADTSTRELLMVNPAICRMLHRSEAELLGLTVDDIHPPDRVTEVLTMFGAMVAGQLNHALEVPVLRADGSIVVADVTSRHTRFDSRPCLVGVFRDASLRRQREQEQVQIQKLESIRTLAAGFAHDFNNILTVLIGNMDLAETYLKQGTEPHELLAEAQRAAFRATTLTRQLLTFAKGGAPLRKVIDIIRLTKDTAELACQGSNVICEFTLPNNQVHVMGDEGQLAQAIVNLVRNAVEAMPNGGLVQVKIDVRLAAEIGKGKEVCITVIDHGSGIEPSTLDRIFLPFFTTKSQGSGLGLAVTYSIVQNHEGRVRVTSSLGAGSTFELLLPTAEVNETETQSSIAPIAQRSGRVLVMDDQAMVRQVVGRMLRQAGYDVCLVSNGETAISSYREAMHCGQPFDAAILDLTVFGGMGGRDAAAALLAMDPNANLVVSSGYSEDGVMSDYAKHGFKAVLPKPYNSFQLVSALAQLIDT